MFELTCANNSCRLRILILVSACDALSDRAMIERDRMFVSFIVCFIGIDSNYRRPFGDFR